ncbi:alpha/beta fold hydrolase [Microbacterium hibisci]|uniref:alpha/beta fold hydrolase n=1 Tax=Microbacterium hibisci TaxID=2036000 RepID=UPI00194155ED|nr:alpha/beta hydrolase [Microbacterium hibisci]
MTAAEHDVVLIDPPVRSLTLADGRTLTWQEFGADGGRPALYFHGGGSTSIEGGIFHREAVRTGIRLIATNRPGALGSTLSPRRPVVAYADDLRELLDVLGVDEFACFGESNGGMMTMATAASMPDRVLGAAPINPTVPWFDPLARRASPASAGVGYRLMQWTPRLVVWLAERSVGKSAVDSDLIGPPPGTEPDVAALHRRMDIERASREGLIAELRWATAPWGFDHYTIPVPLDFFCGERDVQGPFARVLAERNPDARFHEFAYGHNGFSHPDARRRIVDVIASHLHRGDT